MAAKKKATARGDRDRDQFLERLRAYRAELVGHAERCEAGARKLDGAEAAEFKARARAYRVALDELAVMLPEAGAGKEG